MRAKCLCSECTFKSCSRNKTLKRRVIGKKNRTSGRYAENKLFALFGDWGIEIDKTFCSGSKKELAEEFGDKFSGDFNTKGLIGSNVKIENKKKKYETFKRYYELTSNGICHIKGFCYLVPQYIFVDIVKHKTRYSFSEVEDYKYKTLHDFFNQDNAEIVTLISPKPDSNRYLDFIFCVKEDLYEKLFKEQ